MSFRVLKLPKQSPVQMWPDFPYDSMVVMCTMLRLRDSPMLWCKYRNYIFTVCAFKNCLFIYDLFHKGFKVKEVLCKLCPRDLVCGFLWKLFALLGGICLKVASWNLIYSSKGNLKVSFHQCLTGYSLSINWFSFLHVRGVHYSN